MTIKLKTLSGKSFINLHRTIKRSDHVKKINITDKETFFKNKEIKFLFEELLDEIDSETVKEEYRCLPDDFKKDLIWNHQLNLEKNSLLSINIDYKNKNLLKDLANLHYILTFSCICIIKKFEHNKGIKKLLQILVNCLNNNCKDQDMILLALKCLKSFGNNKYGIVSLYKHEKVCEVLCRIICKSHDEECTMALDLLSVLCLINHDAFEKIISCFTKINKNQNKDRFRPLIVCLMNQNKITIQRSVMYFINTMLHSIQKTNNHSIQLRLQLRKELYQLGFETYLNAYRQSDDKILCHQADIFLNKRYIDKEDANFEFLKLQNQLTSLSACQKELNKICRQVNKNEFSLINLFQLLIFLFNRDKANIKEILNYLRKKLVPSLDDSDFNDNEESLSDQLCLINLEDNIFATEDISNDLGKKDMMLPFCEKFIDTKSNSSLSIFDSEVGELICKTESNSDSHGKDSELSKTCDEKTSDLFSLSETDSNSLYSIETEVTNENNLQCGSSHFSVDKDSLNLSFIDFQSHNDNSSELPKENILVIPVNESYSPNSLITPTSRKSCSEIFSFSRTEVTPTSESVKKSVLSPENFKTSFLKCERVLKSNKDHLSTISVKTPSTSPSKFPYSQNLLLPDDHHIISDKLPRMSESEFLAPPPPGPPPPPPPPTSFPIVYQSYSVPNKKGTQISQISLRESVKRINVTLLSEQNINKNSVWLKMMNENYLNDLIIEKIYDRFSRKKSIEVKKKTIKPLIVMDSKNAQNVEIFLRSINMKNDTLMKAFQEMDVTLITLDMITKFIKYIPDQNSLKKLEPFKNNINDLRISEQFLISLLEVKNYKIRLHCMNLQILINTKYLSTAEESLKLVIATFDMLLTSNRFQSLLEMVLFFVKVMNPNKKVLGVSIDSFPKLIDTKDNNNGNLLQFIVEQLQESNPNVLQVWTELDTLDRAVSISVDNINSVINQFSSCLSTVQANIEQLECINLIAKVKTNIDLGNALLFQVKQLQSSLDLKYAEVCEYLSICQVSYSFENLFYDLKLFKQQFINALKQVTERKEFDVLQKCKLETRNKLKKEQIQRSDQLASMLSFIAHEKDDINTKSFFKPETLIDHTIIGISSGKIFCDENALLNWNVKFHRKENHRNRSENIRNRLKHFTPSRTRKIDVSQFVTSPVKQI